jgi:hypothetical protein
MSNMTQGDRDQIERFELGSTDDRLNRATPGQQRVLSVLTPIFIVVLGAMVFAAAQVFDGWPHLIVIGDLIVVVFAIAFWLARR